MQKLIIDNFRQIKHAEIEVKDFLLLIGKQASGKSTIAKLLYFFKNIEGNVTSAILQSNDVVGIIDELKATILEDFNANFGIGDYKITYGFSQDISLTISNNQLWISDGFNTKLKAIEDAAKEIFKYQGEPFFDILKLNSFHEPIKKLFGLTDNFRLIPAGRSISASMPQSGQLEYFARLGKSLDNEIMKDFMRHSGNLFDYFKKNGGFKCLRQDDELSQLLTKYTNQIIQGRYAAESCEVIYYNDKNYVMLPDASSGQQESLRIIQDAMYLLEENVKASRIIEEPEAHLFPIAQKALIELLALIYQKTKSQLIITTHSTHVLATFNNLLYYTKKLKERPEKKTEIERIFGTQGLENNLNITPESFQAYWLDANSDEYCKSIFDTDEYSQQLIGDNAIDNATDEIFNDFDRLLNMED